MATSFGNRATLSGFETIPGRRYTQPTLHWNHLGSIGELASLQLMELYALS